ncbi:cytochrome P450 [Xylaria venustula]|nr:cytochrome P450 [Xylaria venustula]
MIELVQLLLAYKQPCLTVYTQIILILIYRLIFHPLAKFPGPFLAACKYVRYGPNSLSINSATASRGLHDIKSTAYKSPMYVAAKPFFGAEMSLKRINMSVMTPESIKTLGDRMIQDSIVPKVQAPSNKNWSPGHDMASWMSYLTADIILDLTHIVHNFPNGVAGMILCGHMLSLFTFNLHKMLFSDLMSKINQQVSLSLACASRRMQDKNNGIHRDDFWEALVSSRDAKTGQSFTLEELTSETFLFIAAGTDTLNTALAATLFYLSRNPHALNRLTHENYEKSPCCPIIFASSKLQQMSYLLACIDEALRLCPPVPRIILDDEFFPPIVILGIPHYTLHRNVEYFAEPHDFRPERLGRYSCIGRHMAYQEISYILARLIWSFDIRVEPNNSAGEGTGLGSSGRAKKDEYQNYDHHVSEQHGPVLKFRMRDLDAA